MSPRDGLQAESTIVSTEDKLHLIDLLLEANVRHINVTSFVSPRAVPQLADAADLVARLPGVPDVVYDATVPNLVGAIRAAEAGIRHLTLFVSASDAASLSNVRRSTEESMAQALEIIDFADREGLSVVATISNAFGSAYDGVIASSRIIELAGHFRDAGATALALGDTSGEATPGQVVDLVADLRTQVPEADIGLHLHDTRGFALANALAGMLAGVVRLDGAVGGIGGSPFTRNSAGNLPTESLVHMCDESGVSTGVDLSKLLDAYKFLVTILGHDLPGNLGAVGPTKTVIRT